MVWRIFLCGVTCEKQDQSSESKRAKRIKRFDVHQQKTVAGRKAGQGGSRSRISNSNSGSGCGNDGSSFITKQQL